MFKKLIFTFLIVFGMAQGGWGATYHIWKNGQTGQAACGANVICYSTTGFTDASPSGVADLEAVVELAGVTTGTIILISGGPTDGSGITYTGTEIDADSMLGVDEEVAYIGAPRPTDTGYSSHGGTVILDNNDVGADTGIVRPQVHCSSAGACVIGNITVRNGPAGSYGVYTSGNNWTFDDIVATDVVYGFGIIGATGCVINRPNISVTTYPIYSTAAYTLNYGLIYGNSNRVRMNPSSSVINNTLFIGNSSEAIGVEQASSPTINNSMFISNTYGDAARYPILENGTGTIVVNNSLILPNPSDLTKTTSGDVTINNPIYRMPEFIQGNRPAIVVFAVDDYGNISYFETVAAKLEGYGWRGTFALNGPESVTEADWVRLKALVAKGHTVSSHGATYSNQMTSRTGFSMTYAGEAVAADCAVTDSSGDYATGFNCVNDAATVIDLDLTLAANDTIDEVVAVINAGTGSHGYTAEKRNTDSGNKVASKYLHTQTQNVKTGAKNYDLADTRVINGEMRDTKTVIETGLGTTIYTFIHPGNASDETLRAGLLANDYTGARGDGSSSTHLMSSINVFNITPVSLYTMYGNDKDPQNTANKLESYLGGQLEYMKYLGAVKVFYAHNTNEFTSDAWDALLVQVAKSRVMVKTLDDAISYLKTYNPSSDIATADSITYTRTMVNNPDFRLRTNSPAINAGTDLCATLTTATDYAGKPVCAGGAYVGRLSPEIGAYEFPTVGQSTQKNLNLLWMGK